MAGNRAFSESSEAGTAPSGSEHELRTIGRALDDQAPEEDVTEPRERAWATTVGLTLTLIGLITFVVWLRMEVPPF
jgi:hypothetical protein